jgi:hypothetical protein
MVRLFIQAERTTFDSTRPGRLPGTLRVCVVIFHVEISYCRNVIKYRRVRCMPYFVFLLLEEAANTFEGSGHKLQ